MSELKLAFRQTCPNRSGPRTISALSFNNKFLVSAGEDNSITFFDVESTQLLGWIDLGYGRRTTCLEWATNSQFIIGNAAGEILLASLKLQGLSVRSMADRNWFSYLSRLSEE